MDRRDFIKTSGSIVVGSALGGLTFSCQLAEVSPSGWCGFNYAMCNECMAEGSRLAGSQMSWVEQCQIVGDAGYKGVEIATFTLVKEGVQEISPDLSTQETEKIIPRNEGGIPWFAITTISESPVTPGIIWIGTAGGKLRLTKNYGKNWTEMTQKIAGVGGPEKYYVRRVIRNSSVKQR